ncbi:hypothetical protein [Janthinobacterium svalbardensis]|uniref:hypothetical protein n=1 Tax=Janthinobacterium svalbardensis TaxID=368607 RepID=UPI002FCD7149
MQEILSRWLASSAGDYTLVEHPAVHTIDEARMHVPAMPGLMVKNLFVRDEKGRRAFSRPSACCGTWASRLAPSACSR